tara:strand:+ start:772 stop:1566 length:795 start_codon:yes stop_codon:yes gene_type:complete
VYEISIRHKDKGKVSYNIYTKEEADAKSIPYKQWHKAKVGEYALSDDNYVAEVIQRKEYKAKNGVDNVYIRVPWGYTFYAPKYAAPDFSTEGRLTNNTLSGKPQLEVRKGSEEWRALALAYSTCFKADLAIEVAFPDATTNKKRTMKRWMKTQEFKSMVKDELKGLLAEKGYGEGDIIDLLSKAQGMAEQKKDITNFLRVIENIQDMLGMRDKTIVKTTNTLQATATRKLLDEIAEEEAVLIGTKEKVELSNGVQEKPIQEKEE